MTTEHVVTVNADAIPDELAEREQWLYWNAAEDTPRKPLELPTARSGARWSDPDAWLAFDDVVDQAAGIDTAGIGYVNAIENDGYARGIYGTIDIDGCLEWNEAADRHTPKDWVPSLEPFIERGAYIEFSPSKDDPHADHDPGLHIPVVGLEPPEWWADQHFSDGEHSGVEVLTNKFATVTGDALPESGETVVEHGDWLVDWLRKAYEAITGDDPLAASTSDESDGDGAGGEWDGDEWFDEKAAKSALDAIDADVSYDRWRNIAYALNDHFGDTVGKRLFRQWSRDGSKWDSDSERYVDDFFAGSSSGKITVATLIREAQRSGWDHTKHTPSGRRATADGGTATADDDTRPTEAGSVRETDDSYVRFDGTDADGNATWKPISNFAIDVQNRLINPTNGSRIWHLDVQPDTESAYEVTVETEVFNDVRTFKNKVVTGFGTWWKGSTDDLSDVRELLTMQDAPTRTAVNALGIHGDGDDREFVTPDGSLTADGWTDDPQFVLVRDENKTIRDWQLTPDDGSHADRDAVAEVVRLLPQTRPSDRFIPILGWFYAAPFRPVIHDLTGQFNNAHVMGETEAGKSSTLEVLSQAFGLSGALAEASGSKFPREMALSSTNAVPVVLDEYKPSDWSEYTVSNVHDLLRKVTRGATVEKGKPDLSTRSFNLTTPTCVAGEQPIKGPAESRRAVMTAFTEEARKTDEHARAFHQLIGGSYDGEVYDDVDLTQHALAYYQWVLGQETDEIVGLWRHYQSKVESLVVDLGLEGVKDDTKKGYVTVLLGAHLFRAFASQVGDVEPDEHGVTTDAALDAVRYLTTEGKGAEGESHLETLLDLVGRAIAADGYLEENKHYRVVWPTDSSGSSLRLRMGIAFDQVKRYARDHDADDELFGSRDDYQSRFRDAVDDPDTPVQGTGIRTWFRPDDSDDVQCRCVAIAPDAVFDTIDAKSQSERMSELASALRPRSGGMTLDELSDAVDRAPEDIESDLRKLSNTDGSVISEKNGSNEPTRWYWAS